MHSEVEYWRDEIIRAAIDNGNARQERATYSNRPHYVDNDAIDREIERSAQELTQVTDQYLRSCRTLSVDPSTGRSL